MTHAFDIAAFDVEAFDTDPTSVIAYPWATNAAPVRPLLLSDALPVPRTSALAEYVTDVPAPWVYGVVTLEPIQLDSGRTRWLIASNYVPTVLRASVDGYALSYIQGGWTILRTSQPVPDDDTLSVTVQGQYGTPAGIAADVLKRCGWSVSAADFAEAPTLNIGLMLDSGTVREAMASIWEALGVQWSARPVWARLPDAGPLVGTLTPQTASGVSATTGSGTLYSIAVVSYQGGAVTLRAGQAVERFGELSTTFDCPTLRTSRDAVGVGTRLLQRVARPLWSITATYSGGPVVPAPGDRLTVAHPHLPAGVAVVVSRSLRRNGDAVLTLEMPAGSAPPVVLVRVSVETPATVTQSTGVSYNEATREATFTILDENSSAMSGANVTLDGSRTGVTDRFGRVAFRPVTRGQHSLLVEAVGYDPVELEVTV